jgi:membrane protease YdiL (CAAX protease family)
MLLLEQKLGTVGVLRKLVYLLALLCFLVLVVTSFFPVLILKEPIHGYWLILHATFAPVFAICLVGLALMWAENRRFNKNDWPYLQKICFWLIIILAVPLILSIVLSMFPLFGTKGQEFLLDTHRYCALLLALVAIVYTYLIIRTQMEQ